MVLVSVSSALSQTSALHCETDHGYGAGGWCIARLAYLLPAFAGILIAPTHGGMARLSWLGWLVTYISKISRIRNLAVWG